MEITKVTDLETLSNVESGTYTPVVDKNGNAKKVDLGGLKPQLKTINNESLLGSGNISIASGKGISGTVWGAEVFNGGLASQASGDCSHVEGSDNIASGSCSHAEGCATTASGVYSHAEGCATTASGDSSHSEGSGTIAQNKSEHAQGQYNKSNKANTTFGYAGNTIHSVGIGTSDSARKNAFEIMQNGDVYVLGIGGYDGTNAGQSGVKTLQRVIYDLSSSEYDLEDLNLTAKGEGIFEAMFKTTDTTAITAIFSSPNTGDIIKVNLKGIQNGTTYSYEGNMTYNGSEYVSSDNKWTINSTAWVIVKL